MITITNTGAVWAGAGVNATIPFTVVTGRSLVIVVNNESVTNDITGLSDSGGNTWVNDYTDAAGTGQGRKFYRCQTVATVPTTVAATGTGTMHYVIVEATGLHASPFEACTSTGDTPAGTSHGASFTSATSNAAAIVHGIGTASDLATITPTNGYTEIATARNAKSAFYKADLGAPGSQSITYTSSGSSVTQHLIAVYKSAVSDPSVSTVSNESTVEGGTNTHTVTLSGPTNRPNTPYSIALAGVTATGGGVDFTSALASLTFGSSGVTFDGTQLLVPNAVTTFPIVVTAVDDLLDEASETYTLTVGGVSGTGTITDNDAPPVVTFTNGVESFGVVTCVATLGAVSGKDVSFQVDTTNGTKTAGTHYTAIVAQTVTIPAGSLTAAITANTL